jgi:hypothetical protein
MEWSNKQLEQWHFLLSQYRSDSSAVRHSHDIDEQRMHVLPEMTQLLGAFLGAKITVKEFNTTFQQRTHDAWDIFGLKGLSGGMFFNKLVKYIPDEEVLASRLRSALQVPKGIGDGQKQMNAFAHYLEATIATGQATRQNIQPARVSFFLSAWWHIQSIENWPIFYFPLRQALKVGELSKALQDPVEEYFHFRSRCLSLAEVLNISLWELEHICLWYSQQIEASRLDGQKSFSASIHVESSLWEEQKSACLVQPEIKNEQHSSAVNGKSAPAAKEKHSSSLHTHLQWLLAKIGWKVGYQVWIAEDKHHIVWNNERLGDLCTERLPSVENPLAQQLMLSADILWLQKNTVIAVYEVVQTVADISPALLRLCDLSNLFPKRDLHLCVIAPHRFFERVLFELSRPTFHKNERLRNLAFISAEMLVQDQEHILRWARSPFVIHDLIDNLSGAAQH